MAAFSHQAFDTNAFSILAFSFSNVSSSPSEGISTPIEGRVVFKALLGSVCVSGAVDAEAKMAGALNESVGLLNQLERSVAFRELAGAVNMTDSNEVEVSLGDALVKSASIMQ